MDSNEYVIGFDVGTSNITLCYGSIKEKYINNKKEYNFSSNAYPLRVGCPPIRTLRMESALAA